MDYISHARMNELAETLTASDGDTFDPNLAIELRELLTPQPMTGPYLFIKREKMGGGFSGLTSNGRMAQVDDEKETKVVIDTRPATTWAGKFSLRREDKWRLSFVSIADRFLETRDIDNQEGEWLIEYANGTPVAMRVCKNRTFSFSIFSHTNSFTFGTMVHFKKPLKGTP